MAKRPTVYDVARAAGVSTATVSFAYTKPDRVRAETRALVLATADRLGYVPSASARGLASGSTRALGLYAFDYLLEPVHPDSEVPVVPDGRLFPLYADEVQRGVQLECRRRGYALMLGGGRDPGHLPQVIDIAGRVDGLIAFAGAVEPPLMQQLARRIPVVQLGGETRYEGVHTVLVDGALAFRALTAHLLEVHGFRDLVYVGESDTPEFTARYEGFAGALAGKGVTVPPMTPSRPGEDETTARFIHSVLSSRPLPEAFVCATDQEALVVIDTLREAGYSVPNDIAVTGYDGIIAGRLSSPRLTTVRQPMEQIGSTAVRMLTEIVAGNDDADRHEVLHTSLLIGDSCGC